MNQPKNLQEEKEVEVENLDIIGTFDMSILYKEERGETGLKCIDITPEARKMKEAKNRNNKEHEKDPR